MAARAAKSAAADEIAAIEDLMGDLVKRIGADAIKKFADEMETRPLLMLGLAAGIGFLFGMANRR